MSRTLRILFVAIVVLSGTATSVFAHRLDEYLQAAKISLATDHLTVDLRLTPGVAVARSVLSATDADEDGTLSGAEQAAYADRVGRDLALTVDGNWLPLTREAATFPDAADVQAGVGEIALTFRADVPAGDGVRTLTFENHHQPDGAAAVYLANCLVPRDPDLTISGQDRSYDQSFYRVTYTQTAATPATRPAASWLDRTGGASLAKAYVFHGIRHILTGYDHLLFVSALVLAAVTLWDLIKVVSAFTLAHTLTLTLAALNWVHVSEHIVEPMISASIVFIALQNVFRPRQTRGRGRLAAAFFFGLFHGLAFAGGLLDAMQQMPGGTMVLAICAFSIGVETGNQMIVLPLFGLLKLARQSQPDPVTRTRIAMALQRTGSAGISVAGSYYLCVALIGHA